MSATYRLLRKTGNRSGRRPHAGVRRDYQDSPASITVTHSDPCSSTRILAVNRSSEPSGRRSTTFRIRLSSIWRATFGGVAVCEVPRLNELMRYLTRNGFEHHVALAQCACADVLEEAVASNSKR